MNDYIGRVRLRAYLIWQGAGRPEGRDAEHWHQAEREVAEENDAAGLQAGRAYDGGVKEFEKSGRVERAAKERSRRLRVRSGMSSNGHRKQRGARARAMTLPVDASPGPTLKRDLRLTNSPSSTQAIIGVRLLKSFKRAFP